MRAANRLGLDYRAEAAAFDRRLRAFDPGELSGRGGWIVDAHAHINGRRAAAIWGEAASAYGIERVYTQTQLGEAEAVRAVLGDRVRFVAIPEYMASDRRHAMTHGFLENLERWHELGARMVKFWGAPRLRDLVEQGGLDAGEFVAFDSPWRMRVAERAVELGMMLMVHVADPDTWFATRYADASRYGTKAGQYDGLHRLLEAFDVPCLAAHMGGWPEDLGFLDRLLERHARLVLDTSATKWMVRELSRHPSDALLGFLERWRGRVLFGSDIVSTDEHLVESADPGRFAAGQASDAEGAFELYASRYWALRTMFETGYRGESPIADPDLAMVEPGRFGALDAPALTGHALPGAMLVELYRGACERTLDAWYEGRAWGTARGG
ncbi:MAG: hypothetical protein AAF995_09620 [Planctomycetota bacterium]